LMCTVCQAEAIRHAAPGSRGLAGTTLYMGMDLGMILGPLIAGVLYAHLPVELFYPALAITVPMCGIVYVCEMRRRFAR
ncbi:MAG: MFS transporter, partial [Abditibacteriota bacterium]|nr:MFS transporter [Abditibacteriota bacterium]